MPTLARVIARALPNTSFSLRPAQVETLQELMLFCVTGLLAVLLLIMQDMDIGTKLF